MIIKDAILIFSQGEKMKSGILWILQSLELSNSLENQERRGAERIIKINIQQIGQEAHLIRTMTGDTNWEAVEKAIDLAFVMINSGVAQEASFHLGNALHHVTSICQSSMAFLKKEGVL